MRNIFICEYSRTAIGSYQGQFKNISAPKLGATVIREVLKKSSLNKKDINQVIMGNVLSAGIGQAPARQAALYAGLPYSVECMTINKVCGSGLKAIMLAEETISLNPSNIIIAGGMENMSLAPHYIMHSRSGLGFGNSNLKDAILIDGLWDPYNNMAMGNCAETLVKEETFSRKEQDLFAIESYTRSNHAIKEGYFKNEITPVEITTKKGTLVIDVDEEPLKFNKNKITSLKPAFDKEGTITAANASSLNDGAAAVLLASKDQLDKKNITPKARIVSHVSFAMDPLYFTRAPINAIKKVLKKANLNINEIDLFEINEAFSCVPMVAMKELNIPHKKVNIHGGAVSLGHPIGASGARILVTLLSVLERTKKKYGLACLCIGGGEASAMIIERID